MPNLKSPLNLALLAALILITIAGFLLIPADKQLPVHWGLGGEVTATMSRNLALLQMPIGTALIWALFFLIGRSGNAQRRAGTAVVLRWGLPGLTALFLVVQLLIVLTGSGVSVPFFHAT